MRGGKRIGEILRFRDQFLPYGRRAKLLKGVIFAESAGGYTAFALLSCGGEQVVVLDREASCGNGTVEVGEGCDDGISAW